MVTVNDIINNEKRINFDIPQCSVLELVLFSFYINHIYTYMYNLNIDGFIVTYTDDTCLLF